MFASWQGSAVIAHRGVSTVVGRWPQRLISKIVPIAFKEDRLLWLTKERSPQRHGRWLILR
jgi:hypothetical protein